MDHDALECNSVAMEQDTLECNSVTMELDAPEHEPEITAAPVKSRCLYCTRMPSSLWQAVRERDLDMVEAIIEASSIDHLRRRLYCPATYYCSRKCYNYLDDSATNREHVEYSYTAFMPLLHFAVTRGDLQIIDHLIVMGARVDDSYDYRGQSVLQYAVQSNNYGIVDLLIARGANVNIPVGRDRGYRALHLAAGMGSMELVDLLLQRNANPAATTNFGWTALHVAIAENREHLELTKQLLDRGVPVDEIEERGYSALHLAVKSGKTKTVELLLQRKADVCMYTAKGNFPLMMAVKRGHLPIIEILLRHKACPNQRKPNKPSILQTACNRGHETVALRLIEVGANLTDVDQNETHVIHSVVKSGMFPVIQEVISRISPTDLNARDHRGYTPLLWACRKADKETVKLLLENGACVKDKTNTKENVLHCIALSSFSELLAVEMAEFFIDRGVNPVDEYDKRGFTPLHVACIKNKLALVDLFRKRGANIHLRTQYDTSPLLLSVKNGSYASVLYFLKMGAKINEVCQTMGTALHLACKFELRHTVQVLLDHGADINLRNSFDRTPFELINQQNVFESGKIMIRHIAKMTIRGEFVNETDLHTIGTNEAFREIYNEYVAELTSMRTSQFYKTTTWYDVLFMPAADLERLYKNQIFVAMAVAHLKAKPFPVYHREVRAKFERLRMKTRIVEKAEQFVFDIFRGYLPIETMQHIAKLMMWKELKRIENRRLFDF